MIGSIIFVGGGAREHVRKMLDPTTPHDLLLKDGSTYGVHVSPSHVEIVCSFLGQSTRDLHILSALAIDDDLQPSVKERNEARRKIVLFGAHNLSYDAQCALRRIMDDGGTKTQFILTATHTDVIISPILSRCKIVRCKKSDSLLKEWSEISGEAVLPSIKLPRTPADIIELVDGWKIQPAVILKLYVGKKKRTLEEAANRCVASTRTNSAYMWLTL